MCKATGIGIALTTVHGFILAAIGFVIAAIAANGSFWGAVASPGLLAFAGLAILPAITNIMWVNTEVQSFIRCMRITHSKTFQKCSEFANRYDALRVAILAALGSASLGILGLSLIAWIPWAAIPGMLLISAGLASALGLLVALDVMIAQLIDCMREEGSLGKKSINLLDGGTKVFTCPMNKSVCSDADLRLAGQISSGSFSTTASFAIVLKAGSNTISSVKAVIADSYGSSSKALKVLKPNLHSIDDPSSWVIRGDWSILSNDLRIEALPYNIWTVDLEATMNDGTTEKATISLMINN